MGRADLIGNGPGKLIPTHQPAGAPAKPGKAGKPARGARPFRTTHVR